MSALTQKLQDTFGFGRWQGTPAGIVVDGQVVIPRDKLGAWLKGEYQMAGTPPPVVIPPIVRPKRTTFPEAPSAPPPSPPDAAPTPMPFAKPPPKTKPAAAPKRAKKPKKTQALRCSKCNDIWEDCNCDMVWCPYCGFEPTSGTQRGLDMHVKAKHPEIDWG